MPSGHTLAYGGLNWVDQGTHRGKTFWMCTTGGAVVDTDPLGFVQTTVNFYGGAVGVNEPINGGTGAANTGASANLLIGQGTSFTEHGMSGDASITTSGSITVTAIQGTPVVSTPPTTGQILVYNGTNWVPTNNTAITVVGYTF